jgi:hypothetical protein
MARTRALLTETDRRYIAREAGTNDQQYQAISRVRNRIREELATDIELLEEHHEGLLEELREVACEEYDE